MKHLRFMIFLLISTAVMYCNPKEKVAIEKKEMTVEEVVKELGFNPFELSDGSTARRPAKPPKAVVVVWFNDLTIVQIPGGYSTTFPPNAKFSGVQNLATMQSLCNWYLQVGTMNCITSSTGQIRSWCSDMDENIHISNVISN